MIYYNYDANNYFTKSLGIKYVPRVETRFSMREVETRKCNEQEIYKATLRVQNNLRKLETINNATDAIEKFNQKYDSFEKFIGSVDITVYGEDSREFVQLAADNKLFSEATRVKIVDLFQSIINDGNEILQKQLADDSEVIFSRAHRN